MPDSNKKLWTSTVRSVARGESVVSANPWFWRFSKTSRHLSTKTTWSHWTFPANLQCAISTFGFVSSLLSTFEYRDLDCVSYTDVVVLSKVLSGDLQQVPIHPLCFKSHQKFLEFRFASQGYKVKYTYLSATFQRHDFVVEFACNNNDTFLAALGFVSAFHSLHWVTSLCSHRLEKRTVSNMLSLHKAVKQLHSPRLHVTWAGIFVTLSKLSIAPMVNKEMFAEALTKVSMLLISTNISGDCSALCFT